MQNSVMFGILLTILNKRRVNRQTLAEKFEMSPRSISRYVDALAGAGVPLVTFSGPGGGYAIADDFRLDNSFFSQVELQRALTCIKATKLSFDDDVSRNVIDKLENLKRNKEDEKYLLKTDSLIIDVGTWTNPQHYRNKMEAINRAIEGEFIIHFEYVDNKGFKSERNYDPYSLVLKEGVWYTYGFCHYRQEFRLFRLTRMRSLMVTEEKYQKRESDVYQKLSGSFDDMDLVDVEFEFFSTARSEVEEWLGSDAISEKGTTYVASARLYGGNLLVNKLLSFGSSIRILRPASLKEELRIECARIQRRYE